VPRGLDAGDAPGLSGCLQEGVQGVHAVRRRRFRAQGEGRVGRRRRRWRVVPR
jgi:hypothetical protein